MTMLLSQHRQHRRLTTLVENRTTYASDYAELNIFETHAVAEKVHLRFGFPIIASMITGKKIMHLKGLPAFDFLPGESVVMPSEEEMVIDFPLAAQDRPTQCLALGIDTDKINEVAYRFNQEVTIDRSDPEWSLHQIPSHLTHNQELNFLLERLILTFTHNNRSKDILLDLMIQELIIRLLQTKARYNILHDPMGMFSDTRIGTVIKYIKEHLTEKNMSVEALAEKAQMSTSHFHKKFKNTLGVSPIEYINEKKIQFAKKLIRDHPEMFISEVAYQAGFNNVSYFNRQFKKFEMMTPQQFKRSVGGK